MGDDEYLVLWERLLMPVAEEFGPDLVFISAGFDAGKCHIPSEEILSSSSGFLLFLCRVLTQYFRN